MGSKKKKNLLLFGLVVVGWLVLDLASKAHFEFYFEPGEVITDPILGLFRFHLIHNTGAAWGLFGDSTFLLGVVSSVICFVLFIVVAMFASRLSKGELIGLGLVFAGGLGNAIDRFMLGYVRDFIEFTFFDFPVFNIADTGVVCGIILFAICYFMRERKAMHTQSKQGTSSGSDEAAS